MASIHIREIAKLLAGTGEPRVGGEGYFLEIRFDEPTTSWRVLNPVVRGCGWCE
jgi:hypothetical protein